MKESIAILTNIQEQDEDKKRESPNSKNYENVKTCESSGLALDTGRRRNRGVCRSAAGSRDPADRRGDPQGGGGVIRRRRERRRDPLLASQPGPDRPARVDGPVARAAGPGMGGDRAGNARAFGPREGSHLRRDRAGDRHRLGRIPRGPGQRHALAVDATDRGEHRPGARPRHRGIGAPLTALGASDLWPATKRHPRPARAARVDAARHP